MALQWCLSAIMYGGGEVCSSILFSNSLSCDRLGKSILFGATTDALFLRHFHKIVDKKIPSPLFRMICDQTICAPLYNTGYLTLVKGFSWKFDDFLQVYKRDIMFWPCVSFLGYRYIPTRQRYLYVSAMTMVWNTWRASLVQ